MKIIVILWLLVLGIEAKNISLADMKKEQRVAFIIENTDYEGVLKPRLIDKVNGVKKFLDNNGFNVIYLRNANRAETIRSFRSFNVKLKEGGIALFYFRGHCVQLADKNYLLPIDVLEHKDKGVSKVLTINAVLAVMNKANSRMNMLIIDSVDNKELSKELHIKKKGLAKLRVEPNTDLIISSKVNSVRRSRNFTIQLQKIFSEKGVSNRDGFTKFKKENSKAYVKLSQEEFYFKLPSRLLSAEDKLWKKSLALSSLASLNEYLQKYPHGKYRSQASNSIKKIKTKNAEREAKSKEIAKIKEIADKKSALEDEIKKKLELELVKINEAKKKEDLEKLQKAKQEKPVEKTIVEVKTIKKPKMYKQAFYVEPEMVKLISTPTRNSFFIGKYEVSNKEYKAFVQATQNNKNYLRYDRRADEPVVNVSFEEAKEYAQWLSAMSGKKYNLPIEAQWEYAARAGSDTNYFWGNKDVSMKKAYWLQGRANNAHLYAWMKSNSENEVHNIGEKEQNPWGLYDIYGNVSEWCINTDSSDGKQALRGGSFLSDTMGIRSRSKVYKDELYKSKDIGFRLVKEI